MKRAWIAALLLSPLACRGQFDIAQYLADGDTNSESGVDDSTETNTAEAEAEAEAEESEAEAESVDTDEAEAEAETSEQCEDGIELGDGCFGVREMIGIDGQATDLALADFSGDGRIDLLLAGAEFLVLLGDQHGFADTMPLPVSGSAITIGPVDTDELIDFAVIGDSVELYRSNLGGTFVYEAALPVAGVDAVFADIDGDRDMDLLVSGMAVQTLTTQLQEWSWGETLNYDGERLRADDLDGDGDPDIVLARPAADTIALFSNFGTGTFEAPVQMIVPEVRDVATANLDGDERSEVLALSTGDQSVHVLKVSPSFELSQSSVHGVGEQPQRMVVADVDGDGRLDVVTANLGSDDLSLLLGGSGTFEPELRVPLPSRSADPTRIDAADLDFDGRAELVVVGAGHVFVVGYLE